jgi:hypothetical protein
MLSLGIGDNIHTHAKQQVEIQNVFKFRFLCRRWKDIQ